MYYINQAADTSGNHGNPVSHQTEGMVALPESLLTAYIETRGFANITVEDSTITAIAVNQEALDAYLADHPDVPQEDTPTEEDDVNALLVDHEYRLTTLELGLNE